MARRLLFLAAAVAMIAAGCFGGAPDGSPPPPPPPAPGPPPRPTQACGLGFASTGKYQDSFFTLGHTDTGWVTADGFAPVGLPDGRTVWWMSDTMTGTANPDNSVPNPGNVHNTIVQRSGSAYTDVR